MNTHNPSEAGSPAVEHHDLVLEKDLQCQALIDSAGRFRDIASGIHNQFGVHALLLKRLQSNSGTSMSKEIAKHRAEYEAAVQQLRDVIEACPAHLTREREDAYFSAENSTVLVPAKLEVFQQMLRDMSTYAAGVVGDDAAPLDDKSRKAGIDTRLAKINPIAKHAFPLLGKTLSEEGQTALKEWTNALQTALDAMRNAIANYDVSTSSAKLALSQKLGSDPKYADANLQKEILQPVRELRRELLGKLGYNESVIGNSSLYDGLNQLSDEQLETWMRSAPEFTDRLAQMLKDIPTRAREDIRGYDSLARMRQTEQVDSDDKMAPGESIPSSAVQVRNESRGLLSRLFGRAG